MRPFSLFYLSCTLLVGPFSCFCCCLTCSFYLFNFWLVQYVLLLLPILVFCHFVCVIAYAQSVQEVGCSFSQRYVYIALVHINHICFFATAEDVILRSAKHCILTELSTCSVHGVSSVTAQSHAPCKVAILTPCTWVSFTDCLRGPDPFTTRVSSVGAGQPKYLSKPPLKSPV